MNPTTTCNKPTTVNANGSSLRPSTLKTYMYWGVGGTHPSSIATQCTDAMHRQPRQLQTLARFTLSTTRHRMQVGGLGEGEALPY
eukprot:619255-Prymnesium_polylepis.2